MKNNKGFTLIELLITTSLTVLLMLGITSLFMTFLIGNSKTNIRKTVKEEGIHALSQMEFLLKNAQYIDITSCTGSTNDSITFTSFDGGITTFGTVDTGDGVMKIASDSGVLSVDSPVLTSSTVEFLTPLTFICTGPVGNRQVKINFALSKQTADGLVEETFNSTVSVRN